MDKKNKLVQQFMRWVFRGLFMLAIMGCDGFLEVKPDQSLVVPTTLEDVQALLDNTDVFNSQPALPLISSEEVWISDEGYAGLRNPVEQEAYTWADDPFLGGYAGDWENVYEQVFYANVALEVLQDYEGEEDNLYNELLGTALFFRSYAYLQLVSQFAPPYQKEGANSHDLGIVLKETADVNEQIRRSTLGESYSRIVGDLNRAQELLPERNDPKTRPSKAAALGVLSRVHLMVYDYSQAATSASRALELYTSRMDLNTIDVNASRPFERFNAETIFYSTLYSYSFMRSNQVFVDSTLTGLYGDGDLRVPAFYDENPSGGYNYTGKLSGNTSNFGGLTVGELFLNAAEGFARIGEEEKAKQYLNSLLALRYEKSKWKPLGQLGQKELLERVLEERRKELIGRGLRWTDLRRLNQEGAGIVLTRIINGQKYTLSPNSGKYTFPIPEDEVSRSGITQNNR